MKLYSNKCYFVVVVYISHNRVIYKKTSYDNKKNQQGQEEDIIVLSPSPFVRAYIIYIKVDI